jgi:exonuclease 3'-5' domain-containing protein 1
VFDCRADADALFHQFDVLPQNVIDVPVVYCKYLLQVDTEGLGDHTYLKSLANAIEYCSSKVIPQGEKQMAACVKESGRNAFAPEKGGSFEVWKKRPLGQELADYTSCDVKYLPARTL